MKERGDGGSKRWKTKRYYHPAECLRCWEIHGELRDTRNKNETSWKATRWRTAETPDTTGRAVAKRAMKFSESLARDSFWRPRLLARTNGLQALFSRLTVCFTRILFPKNSPNYCSLIRCHGLRETRAWLLILLAFYRLVNQTINVSIFSVTGSKVQQKKKENVILLLISRASRTKVVAFVLRKKTTLLHVTM